MWQLKVFGDVDRLNGFFDVRVMNHFPSISL